MLWWFICHALAKAVYWARIKEYPVPFLNLPNCHGCFLRWSLRTHQPTASSPSHWLYLYNFHHSPSPLFCSHLPVGLWHGGVPGQNQSLRDLICPQECGRHQGHHPWRTQGLRVPGQGLWGHAHLGEELSQAWWGTCLQALPSGGSGCVTLSPGRHRAGWPQTAQVCLHWWEKVRKQEHGFALNLRKQNSNLDAQVSPR